MVELEKFLISEGIDDVDYGIASNIEGNIEVKYWNKNGDKIHLKGVKINIEPGLSYFIFKDGILQKI